MRSLAFSVTVIMVVTIILAIMPKMWTDYHERKVTEVKKAMIDKCTHEAYEIIDKEWVDNCIKHSATKECDIPVGYYKAIEADLIKQYMLCMGTYK